MKGLKRFHDLAARYDAACEPIYSQLWEAQKTEGSVTLGQKEVRLLADSTSATIEFMRLLYWHFKSKGAIPAANQVEFFLVDVWKAAPWLWRWASKGVEVTLGPPGIKLLRMAHQALHCALELSKGEFEDD